MDIKFSSNIKVIRQKMKVTQTQLAEDIGLSNGIISLWESGLRTPSADAIIKLSRYFQLSTDYILKVTDDDSMLQRVDDFVVDMTVFNSRLKELRAAKSLSQEQLANRTGLTKTSINHWENGKCLPNANAIIILAYFFGVTTDYLLGESD